MDHAETERREPQAGTGGLEQRMESLERRLLRVERQLELLPSQPVESPVVRTPPPALHVRELTDRRDERRARESAQRIAAAPPIANIGPARPVVPPIPPLATPFGGASVQPAVAPVAATPPSAPSIPPVEKVLRYQPRPEPKRESGKSIALEQVIGLKLAGWIGAIVLVIGTGLGIKYAYDQGWFGFLSPTMRLAMMYAGGFGLIAAGEVVYRRVHKISATGLFGAGVATLFLVSYAGHAYYGLYQQQTAFTLMAISTLVGAVVAMRGRLVSIAALSLIGGFVAPGVLRGDSGLIIPFLCYLMMLQVVALVLSWWGRSMRWWALRGLSLAGTTVWIAASILLHVEPASAAMWLILAIAFLYHAELILSSMRKAAHDGAGVAFGFIVTTLLTAVLLAIHRDAPDAVRGCWVAGLAAATLGAGLLLRHFGRNEQRSLSYGYRIQSVVLLLVAVPVAFSGSAITVGFAGVALGLALLGAKLSDRPTRYASVAAWGLAIVNLAIWTVNSPTRPLALAPWFNLLGQPIVAASVIGWALVALGHAIAALFALSKRAGATDRDAFPALSWFASALFAVVTIGSLPPLGATGLLLAYLWLLVGSSYLTDRLAQSAQAGAMLALATGKWIVIDTLASRLATGWTPADYLPVLNPLMLTGALVAGSMVAFWKFQRDKLDALLKRPSAGLMLTLVAALIGLGLSLEIDRIVIQLTHVAWPREQLRQLAWTTLWTGLVVASLWCYTRIDRTARERAGWRLLARTLMPLLALKLCLFDMPGLWWGSRGAGVGPILNMQTLAALVVAGGLFAVHLLLRGSEAMRVALSALGVILWAGTLEIDRLVAAGAFPGVVVWPAWQLRQFAWSAWWTTGIVGYLFVAVARDPAALRQHAGLRKLAYVPAVLAVKYLLLDTLAFRVLRLPAPVTLLINFQTLAGALIVAGLIVARQLLDDNAAAAKLRGMLGALAILMLLGLGSFEIDRAFERPVGPMVGLSDPELAKQVALSVYWSAFAIGAVTAGFVLRIAGLRYFGLALFAITLAKVGLIDLRDADRGYRILSFIALGLLMLGTSVLYGKLSPRLLREPTPVAS